MMKIIEFLLPDKLCLIDDVQQFSIKCETVGIVESSINTKCSRERERGEGGRERGGDPLGKVRQQILLTKFDGRNLLQNLLHPNRSTLFKLQSA